MHYFWIIKWQMRGIWEITFSDSTKIEISLVTQKRGNALVKLVEVLSVVNLTRKRYICYVFVFIISTHFAWGTPSLVTAFCLIVTYFRTGIFQFLCFSAVIFTADLLSITHDTWEWLSWVINGTAIGIRSDCSSKSHCSRSLSGPLLQRENHKFDWTSQIVVIKHLKWTFFFSFSNKQQ